MDETYDVAMKIKTKIRSGNTQGGHTKNFNHSTQVIRKARRTR